MKARDIFLVDKSAFSEKEAQKVADSKSKKNGWWDRAFPFNEEVGIYDWIQIQRDWTTTVKEIEIIDQLYFAVLHRNKNYWIFLLGE